MPSNIDPILQTRLETGGGILATFLRVRRRLDGQWDNATALGFSDFPLPKVWDGVTYYSTDGIDITNISRSSDTSIGSSGIEGVLKTDRITARAIQGKVFLGAELLAFNLLYDFDTASWYSEILARGILGNMTLRGDGLTFATEYRDILELLAVDSQRRVTANCGFTYGDPATCGIDMTGRRFTADVFDVSDDQKTITFDSFSQATDFFSFSPLKSLDGANLKMKRPVIKHTKVSGRAVLQLAEPFAFDVNIGDSMLLEQGCDHTWGGPTGCKFQGNAKRYGGFPHLAGNRKLRQTGTSGSIF